MYFMLCQQFHDSGFYKADFVVRATDGSQKKE